jgi:GNAT superfamily N-acetyltransferase
VIVIAPIYQAAAYAYGMVSFREEPADAPSALSLLTQYFDDRAQSFPVKRGGYTTTASNPANFVRPNGVFLVVEDVGLDDEPADVGCGGIRRIGSGANGLVRFEVKHLWLKPFLRGRGFGRVLLGELERRAVDDFGAEELVLDTNDSLEAAGALYRNSHYVDIEPYNDNPNATNWFGKIL